MNQFSLELQLAETQEKNHTLQLEVDRQKLELDRLLNIEEKYLQLQKEVEKTKQILLGF